MPSANRKGQPLYRCEQRILRHAVQHAERLTGRTVLSDDALSILVPVLEDRLGWDRGKIRAYFDAQGFALREWDKIRTGTITLCPTNRDQAASSLTA